MKTVTNMTYRWVSRRTFCAALAIWLVGVLGVHAQNAVVTTLSGGFNSGSSSIFDNSGFEDGNTALTAQFNTPAGMVLDQASLFLYVADTGNGAVRRLDLAGNLTTTLASGLSSPVDLAIDGNTNLYILNRGNSSISRLDIFNNLTTLTLSAPLATPTAIAIDSSTNLYVTELGGRVLRINPLPPIAVVTPLVPAGTFSSPRGIEVMDNGMVVVSDTGNHAIRTFSPNTPLVITTVAGLVGTSGTNNGPVGTSRFNGPRGIAKAGNNILIVADEGNNQVRRIAADGTTTLFYGVPTSVWASLPPEAFPGWLNDEDGDSQIESESRDPEGVAIDGSGNVYVTEQFYHIIRKVTGTGLTGPSGTSAGSGTNTVLNPPSLAISPNTGYFPMGQTITVSSTSPNVFFTVDGTAPTTNSTPVGITNGVGFIQWFNSTNDLRGLRVAAFNISGTNIASTNIAGLAASTNSIGIPGGINTNIYAGLGATIVVPVVLNLRPTDAVRSYQFRVEVTANAGSVLLPEDIAVEPTGTNSFVPLITSETPVITNAYTIPPFTRGLSVSSFQTTNTSFANFGVVALIKLKIPSGAGVNEGDTYTVQVLQPSATSDGNQTSIPLAAAPPTTILLTNIAYIVGDSAPGRWYNAGDFGDGNLSNADVNNVGLASLGIREPFKFTDAWDAMNAFFEDLPGFPGGDNVIDFEDVNLILNRSLRLPSATENWIRAWSNGARTNALTALPLLPAEELELLPGTVWNRQALLGAKPVGNAVAGQWVNVPVYLRVGAGFAISGLQFMATIEPTDGAPAIQGVTFNPASGVSNPGLPYSSANRAGGIWFFGTLNFAGGTSNLFGNLRFQIPASATSGQTYRVRLDRVSGKGEENSRYHLENLSTSVRVGAPAEGAETISEQWLAHFFGSSTNPLAAADADPDEDGISNLSEFLAGTNPNSANSRLHVESGELRQNGNAREIAFKLLTAPGKTYVLETTSDLVGGIWTPVATMTGDGSLKEFVESNSTNASQFYRVRLLP